jgi:hypothetical protein
MNKLPFSSRPMWSSKFIPCSLYNIGTWRIWWGRRRHALRWCIRLRSGRPVLPSTFHTRISIFFSWHNISKREKICQIATKLPNDPKMYQMDVIHIFQIAKEYTNLFHSKFTQSGIFRLKICTSSGNPVLYRNFEVLVVEIMLVLPFL